MSLAARLNKRVIIQRRTTARDEIGQPLPDAWENVIPGDGKVWAEVRDISGRAFIAAGAEQSKVQTAITIRHRAGIAEQMRVLCGADTYQIDAALGQDGRTIQLMCSRVSA